MAEFVDRRLERGLGELEQMVRVGLFTEQELKAIIAKRRRLEYAVQRYEKSVEDHLKYVKYEMTLLDLIKLRRAIAIQQYSDYLSRKASRKLSLEYFDAVTPEHMRLGYNFKFSDIEGSIGNRCQARLVKAEAKFPNNMEVWNLHIDLCRKLNWNPIASQIYTRMLQMHSDKPEIWMDAARFELNENGSPDNARALCMKALRWHEKNPDMWRHHLRIELKIALKVFQRAEILNISTADVLKDAITSGKVASIVARNAINVIGNISFAASLYEMVYTMGRTDDMPEDLWHPVCELILRIITEKFGNDVDYFTCRAEFCLLPLRLMSRKSEHETLKAEDESYKVFDEAVKAHDTGSTWRSYLRFIAQLFKTSNALDLDWLELPKRRFLQADTVFEEADLQGHVDFDHYLIWAEICLARNRKREALSILEKALLDIPQTIEAYTAIFELYDRASDDRRAVVSLIKKARQTLDTKNPEFWRNYLNWLTIFLPEEVEPALKEGLKESRQIIAVVATHYLQWAYSKSAIQGRKVYNEIRRIPGVFAEPFVKLIIAEEKKVSSPIEELRQILDEATTNLPNSVDLWMEYMKLELEYPDGDPSKLKNLAWKAQRTLKPDLVGLFVTMYNLLLLQPSSDD